MALITDCRNSIWSAIDNAAELADAFAYKFRFNKNSDETEVFDSLEPSISDLPGIMIMPTQIEPVWAVNVGQEYTAPFVVTIWTPDWDLETAEALSEKVQRAIWQTGPSANVSYIRSVTGFLPRGGLSALHEFTRLGGDGGNNRGVRVTKTTITVVLRPRQNPLTA